MTTVRPTAAEPAPLWMRRPRLLHVGAYAVAALVLAGQLVAALARGSDLATYLAVLVAGVGVAVSWRLPWTGLVVTSAATLAITAVDEDPLSVWMMAVLVLFSVTFRGRQPVVATVVVAGFLLGAFMTVGGFRGGAVVGCAALFSAIAGGAAGAALRIYREHWLVLDERTRTALATRELEAHRRVVEERLRIARDLHDVVGHQVAMLSVHLGVAEIGLPPDAEASREALEAARTSARNVVVETQRTLALLRRGDVVPDDEALQPTPSIDGLGRLVASFEEIGLDVDASVDVAPGTTATVEHPVDVAVYRVVQEALTNAYRHGEGTATVTVGEERGTLTVVVSNAVRRAAPAVASGGGYGLVGMRERVESCGGRLQVERTDDRFRVRAEFALAGAVPA